MSQLPQFFTRLTAVCCGMILLAGSLQVQAAEESSASSSPAQETGKIPEFLLDEEVLSQFATLPVMEQGRIKPLDTVSRFRLLSYHGKQSIKVKGLSGFEGQKKLSAIQWLLLSWFRPELAKDLPLFVVDNSDAVVEIGMEPKGKRDRYSYNEVFPFRDQLLAKAQEASNIEAKDRTSSQRYLLKLGADFFDYTLLIRHFDFASAPFGASAETLPKELVTDPKNLPSMSELLPKISEYFSKHPEILMPMGNPQPWVEEFSRMLMTAKMSRNAEQALRIFPPSIKEDEVWHSPGSVIQSALESAGNVSVGQLDEFNIWEQLYHLSQKNDAEAFKAKISEFHQKVIKAAQERGEGKYLSMEVNYHKRDYMTNALAIFLLGLILLAVSWAAPVSKWGKVCVVLCWICMVIGALLVSLGIVLRCIIMQRPPVATLYETIIFITATGVIFSLIAEWLSRRKGIALLVAALIGTAGMFISLRHMRMEGTDTLQQLQAVLLTNFWLATHVPIVNLGYAAGMVSAIIAMIYFVGRLIGKVQLNSDFSKDLTRISYGFIMGGLFLSLVGTILGGIWANYSWGRFWGWDPKENGALLIVLMNLIILHARLGGYIREIGFHACAILLGMIVVFSWFGVNQLSVGLHNYGFTDGASFWLSVFWGSQLLILLYAAVLKLLGRSQSKSQRA